MILAPLFKGQLGPLRSFRSPSVTPNTSSRPPSVCLDPPPPPPIPPPPPYLYGVLKCQHQVARHQRAHSHPSAQPELRRDLLHLGAIRRLHSSRIPLREKPLSPPFSHLAPSKKHRRVPRFTFLWVKNNTKASADISAPDMSCPNDQPAPQPKHAHLLPLQNKKKKKETLMVAEGPFMNMLLCVAQTHFRFWGSGLSFNCSDF